MLLLDHNLPHQLRALLAEFGHQAESTRYRGWEELRNGDLVAAAHAAGFKAILTRDVKFAESAARALSRFPSMAIVIVRLHQRSWEIYKGAFSDAWDVAPIIPQPGKVISWP